MIGTAARGVGRAGRRGLGRVVIRTLLVFAIAALIVVFARDVDWAYAWRSVRNADARWIAAALLANFASTVLKGVRWWVFLRAIGVDRFGLAQRATFAGAGLNNLLVANGGEAARVLFVARDTGSAGSAVLATLAVERVFDIIGYLVLLAGATLLVPLPPGIARWRWPSLAALAVSCALLAWLAREARGRGGQAPGGPAAAPEPARRGARVRRAGARFGEAFAASAGGGRFAAALALSLGAWLLQLATYAWTARAAGLALPPAGHLSTLLMVNLAFLVRITPGNVGVFQVAYALAAAPFGAARDPAIATALLLQTLQVVPITALGVGLAPGFIFRRRAAVS